MNPLFDFWVFIGVWLIPAFVFGVTYRLSTRLYFKLAGLTGEKFEKHMGIAGSGESIWWPFCAAHLLWVGLWRSASYVWWRLPFFNRSHTGKLRQLVGRDLDPTIRSLNRRLIDLRWSIMAPDRLIDKIRNVDHMQTQKEALITILYEQKTPLDKQYMEVSGILRQVQEQRKAIMDTLKLMAFTRRSLKYASPTGQHPPALATAASAIDTCRAALGHLEHVQATMLTAAGVPTETGARTVAATQKLQRELLAQSTALQAEATRMKISA